jgi:hypothetical protein
MSDDLIERLKRADRDHGVPVCSEAAAALASKDKALSEMRAELEQANKAIEALNICIKQDDEREAVLRAELERARKALEDAEDTLHLVEQPAFRDPHYGDEVEALGRRIGFGALMSSASASWREYLATSGSPVGGEFVAGPCHGTIIATLANIRAARAQADGETP